MSGLLRRMLRTGGGRTVVGVMAVYLAFKALMFALSPAKVHPRVEQAMAEPSPVNVVIELDFSPERFHILVMQDYGRVTGTDGNRVEVRNMAPEGVWEMARKFWVRSIVPLDDPG